MKCKKNMRVSILVTISVLAVFLLFAMIAFFLLKKENVVKENITVEAGTKSISVQEFLINKDSDNNISFVANIDAEKLSQPGEYPVKVLVDGDVVECKVKVVDTTSPTATAVEHKVLKGEALEAEKFVKDINDVSDVTVEFKKNPHFSKLGSQDVAIILTDSYKNKTEIIATLTIVEDTTPPEINGVKDLTAYVGGTINYRKNVKLEDDFDSNPKLSVDSKDVDLSKEGKYTVTYTATDKFGNSQKKTATVTVTKKPQKAENKTVNKKEEAFKLADKVIDSIIKDGMTTKQKVKAIYSWARGNIGYSGKSDKSDYRVEAYNTFKNRSGDCFSYYAATRIMFERLNIPNISVVKVKNYEGDSRHYWSLVSVDGGKNYYHFDATPRKGSGDDFCLVTDEFLDAYSNAHKKSHNRDKSLYPATPTEGL